MGVVRGLAEAIVASFNEGRERKERESPTSLRTKAEREPRLTFREVRPRLRRTHRSLKPSIVDGDRLILSSARGSDLPVPAGPDCTSEIHAGCTGRR